MKSAAARRLLADRMRLSSRTVDSLVRMLRSELELTASLRAAR
jgi:hypothetical protein